MKTKKKFLAEPFFGVVAILFVGFSGSRNSFRGNFCAQFVGEPWCADFASWDGRLNRPEKKNALTQDMYRAMNAALEEGEASDEIRVHVMLGVEGTFTSGNDIADFMKMASSVIKPMPKSVNAMPATIRSASAPMIRSSSTAAVWRGGRWRR